MKKIIFGAFVLFSTLSFSENINLKNNNTKIPAIEFKTTVSGIHNFNLAKASNFSINAKVYKPFYVSKINTLFNVGAGFDFVTYFSYYYEGIIEYRLIPKFLFEVGGYVHKDVKMYAGLEMGGAINLITSLTIEPHLSLTYKDHLTFEVGYSIPTGLKVAVGSRFGYTPKSTIKYVFVGEDNKKESQSLK